MYIISRLCSKQNWFYHDCFSKPVDALSVLVSILKGEMMDHSFMESLSMFNWAYRIPITINRILCFYLSAFRGKLTEQKMKAYAKCLLSTSRVMYIMRQLILNYHKKDIIVYSTIQVLCCAATDLYQNHSTKKVFYFSEIQGSNI